MSLDETVAWRELLDAGMRQYGLEAGDLADHAHARDGTIAGVTDGPAIECPCAGERALRRGRVVKMLENARSRCVTPARAYALLCMLNSARKTLAWRKGRDVGADAWLWRVGRPEERAYLWPLEQPGTGRFVPVAFPAGEDAEAALAREIADELCGCGGKSAEIRTRIERFLTRRRAKYAGDFASWFREAAASFRVVPFDEESTERVLYRIGTDSSGVYERPVRRTRYEIHCAGFGPAGDRAPKPEEVLGALIASDPKTAAIKALPGKR